MTRLERRSAYILLAVLALVAVIGFEQGVVHGLAAVRADGAAAAANSDREPVPSAQPLSNATAAMDEPTVRRIAKEEADAAVARARPKKAAPKPETDDSASDDADTPASPPPVYVPPPTTAPAPGT